MVLLNGILGVVNVLLFFVNLIWVQRNRKWQERIQTAEKANDILDRIRQHDVALMDIERIWHSSKLPQDSSFLDGVTHYREKLGECEVKARRLMNEGDPGPLRH